jgi:hypothetical protein
MEKNIKTYIFPFYSMNTTTKATPIKIPLAVRFRLRIEILNPDGEISISIIRRALQREHLELLSQMSLRQMRVPEDAQTLARYQLKQLNKMITQVIQKHPDQMDAYTLAHLEVSRDRIFKTLNAQIQSD